MKVEFCSKTRRIQENCRQTLRMNRGPESFLTLPTYWVFVCVWVQLLSRVQLFGTPWTVTHQAHLSMGFSQQEYWSGLPCPPAGDRPNPGIKPVSPALLADSLLLSHWEAQYWGTKGQVNCLVGVFIHQMKKLRPKEVK